MKARLWPALLFTIAVASLPYVAGCTINEHEAQPPPDAPCPDQELADRTTLAAAFCTMLYCSVLGNPEAPELLGDCQDQVEAQLWVTDGRYTWECAADMFEVANACPDNRELPASCD